MKFTKAQKQENRAHCMNKVHAFADRVVPNLITELDRGFRIKADNRTFFEKDRQRINKVIEAGKLQGDIFRALIQVMDGSIWINIEDHYSVSDTGCDYYKKSYHLYDRSADQAGEYIPADNPQITAAHLVEADQRLQAIADQLSDLRAEQSQLKLLTGDL